MGRKEDVQVSQKSTSAGPAGAGRGGAGGREREERKGFKKVVGGLNGSSSCCVELV